MAVDQHLDKNIAADKQANADRFSLAAALVRAKQILGRLSRQLAAFLSRRSLLGEILTLQLMFAVFVGVLAFGGLWVSSAWVADDNTRKWGEQWLESLDDIGMPLYVSQDADRYLRVEEYVARFPEISFVRFYSSAGELIFEDKASGFDADIALLNVNTLNHLADQPIGGNRQILDAINSEDALLRIGKPIWTESYAEDGLLGFAPDDSAAVEETLVGFVELGLNSRKYQGELRRNIRMGTMLGALMVALLTIASWFIYRRALLPLSQLQEPLKKLAMGRTDFTVETAGHTEIVSIADALNSTVTALKERDKKLWHLANHDQLTGLINRHRFSELLDDELERLAIETDTSALLFLDLDQFKYVNDTVGHAAGDKLLQYVAERLHIGVRQTDVIGRFGGDEFVILLRGITRPAAEEICEQLVESMDKYRFIEHGESFAVRCSIGITMIEDDALKPAEILSQADTACHHAKTHGRNRFDFYTATSDEMDMAKEVSWSRQIHEALENDSFLLYFQPICDIETHEPAHYEVLLRMRNAAGELILPDAFLPAANRFGLMVEIDRWVISHSLVRLKEFRVGRPSTCFTLNVSGPMFEQTDLAEFLQAELSKHDLPFSSIVLEVTEQVAFRTVGPAGDQIAHLSELGCKFALDDFGAGYSSYSYLKTLPVDFIKIDGAFIGNIVNDFVDQKIVGSIIEIAKATGKLTIAEHVADYETFKLLRELGIDYAQGYFLGEPADTLKARAIPKPLSIARKKRSAN
jgi:diguanylate cyclase (GGDEF)-like protein